MLRYFISKEFLVTIVALISFGLIIYLTLFYLFLPSYTKFGKSVLVPDVNTLAYEEASEVLESNGLRIEVRDSTYQPDLPGKTVYRQYPLPMTNVKPNRKIYLTLNKQQPPIVPLPALKGKNIYQVRKALESWKLGVGEVDYRPDISDEFIEARAEGKLLEPGDELPQGTKIDLLFGERTEARTGIPNLINLSYEEAVREIFGHKLSLGVLKFTANGSPDNDGMVYNQSPSPFRDSIKQGTPVDIWIYGEEPETIEGIDSRILNESETSEEEEPGFEDTEEGDQ